VPEDIRVNKELGVIEIDSHNKVSYEDGLSSLAMLQELLGKSGIRKVLADTRKQDFQPSTMNIYDFGTRLPQNVQIAVIISQNQPTADDISFLDNVAFNRGVNIRLFGTRSDALEWLAG
jgi:hypothetical protein